MRHPQVVAAVGQAVVAAEGVIAGGDVGWKTAVAVAARRRQPVGPQFRRHPTAGRQGVLEVVGENMLCALN